jgi:hypothetical protein
MEGDGAQINGMGQMPPVTDNMAQFGLIPAQDGVNNLVNNQNQMSRSSSINGQMDDRNRDRQSMPSMPNSNVSTRPGSYEQPYNGDVQNNINPQLANYSMPPAHAQNGMPMFGGANQTQQSNLDWAQMFQAGKCPLLRPSYSDCLSNATQMPSGTTNRDNSGLAA